jgi:hypothetical protein
MAFSHPENGAHELDRLLYRDSRWARENEGEQQNNVERVGNGYKIREILVRVHSYVRDGRKLAGHPASPHFSPQVAD